MVDNTSSLSNITVGTKIKWQCGTLLTVAKIDFVNENNAFVRIIFEEYIDRNFPYGYNGKFIRNGRLLRNQDIDPFDIYEIHLSPVSDQEKIETIISKIKTFKEGCHKLPNDYFELINSLEQVLSYNTNKIIVICTDNAINPTEI